MAVVVASLIWLATGTHVCLCQSLPGMTAEAEWLAVDGRGSGQPHLIGHQAHLVQAVVVHEHGHHITEHTRVEPML